MENALVGWDDEGLRAWDATRGEGSVILLHSLRGFIDAGHAGRVLVGHLLGEGNATRLATFEVDRLLDYRSRRPEMTFSVNAWTAYDEPYLQLDRLVDSSGTPFLLLHGSEPDVQWEAYIRAVRGLVERLGVSLVVGAHGIPMAAPHTRPLAATVHGTRPDLLPSAPGFFGTVTVPASVMNLLEYRFGQWGLDAASVAVHVPHYLSQSPYPQAARQAMESIRELTGLDLDSSGLEEASLQATEEIERQMSESDDVQALVQALEEQYDAFVESRQGVLPLDGILPTAEEIGAEFERFLADRGPEIPGLP